MSILQNTDTYDFLATLMIMKNGSNTRNIINQIILYAS